MTETRQHRRTYPIAVGERTVEIVVDDTPIEPGLVFGLPPEEWWQELFAKYNRYLQPMAILHRSEVPDSLKNIVEFKELDLWRQSLLDSQLRVTRINGEIEDRNQRRKARHAVEVENATLRDSSGTSFPPPLELEPIVGPDGGQAFYDRYHALLEAAERGLLLERQEDWRAFLAAQSRPARKRRALANKALAEADAEIQPFEGAVEKLEAELQAQAYRRGGSASARSDERSIEVYGGSLPRVVASDDTGRGLAAKRGVEAELREQRVRENGGGRRRYTHPR